ncbi:hypothetical protein F5Y13DRAFT_169921 [Hypoxylon sp. FL1857]|nr:hypothetical protein F5Y13DRAFT_169921 [Hypoxylon sp. FL1857]
MNYADQWKVRQNIPNDVGPNHWPILLPLAKAFASKHSDGSNNPRFAILRVWSAPHFYPVGFGKGIRYISSFLDGATRSWVWRCVPKDLPNSGGMMYRTLELHLGLRKDRLAVGERVIHRNEVILVMGLDEIDLLNYVTAVT